MNSDASDKSMEQNAGEKGAEQEQRIVLNPTPLRSMIFFVVFWIIIIGVLFLKYYDLGWGKKGLDIIAAVEKKDNLLTVRGRVLHIDNNTLLVKSANVWVVADDNRGNRYSSTVVKTNQAGMFIIEDIPMHISGDTTKPTNILRIFGKATIALNGKEKDEKGEEMIALGLNGHRVLKLPAFELLFIPLIFFASIILALLQAKDHSFFLIVKYYSSVLLAFLFTFIMIIFISIGLSRVNLITGYNDNEIISLGFASIYKGNYVKDVEPQWLISLTFPKSPTKNAPESSEKLARGLGAPLWVLLLSVMGAGIYTVVIIIESIEMRLECMTRQMIRKRVQDIVMHQFYILFSPLGAISVYQLLVAGGAAKEYITVALAGLAAGIAMNLVLDKALTSVKSILSISKEDKSAA